MNPVTFVFPGYGPEASTGYVVPAGPRRLVITDTPDNPSTSVTSAIGSAAVMARRAVGAADDATIFVWRAVPDEHAGGLWSVSEADGETVWQLETEPDAALASAVTTLIAAVETAAAATRERATEIVDAYERLVQSFEPVADDEADGRRLEPWLQEALSATIGAEHENRALDDWLSSRARVDGANADRVAFKSQRDRRLLSVARAGVDTDLDEVEISLRDAVQLIEAHAATLERTEQVRLAQALTETYETGPVPLPAELSPDLTVMLSSLAVAVAADDRPKASRLRRRILGHA